MKRKGPPLGRVGRHQRCEARSLWKQFGWTGIGPAPTVEVQCELLAGHGGNHVGQVGKTQSNASSTETSRGTLRTAVSARLMHPWSDPL